MQYTALIFPDPDRDPERTPDPDSDADRHQNVISWSLGHSPALHKISSKSIGITFSIIQWIRISDSWIRTVIRIVTKI